MQDCATCGIHPRIPGEHYDSRDPDTLKNLDGLIKIAQPVDELPPVISFVSTSLPKMQEDGGMQINLDMTKYVRLDRLPEPLRTLVTDLLDVKAT